MKLCAKCKHYQYLPGNFGSTNSVHRCRRDTVRERVEDVVTGSTSYRDRGNVYDAYEERYDRRLCGIDGKLWEESDDTSR